MKIFGREPTLWLAALSSFIVIVGTFGLDLLNGQQAALLVVAINAVFAAINAYAVRPISPVAFTYAIGALVSLGALYGIVIPDATLAAVNGLVVPLLALLARGQVSPVTTPVTETTPEPTPEAAAKG